MVFHDFTIPIVYAMAFLAMALNKVAGDHSMMVDLVKLFITFCFFSPYLLKVLGIRLLRLSHQLAGLLLLLLLLHLLTSWLLF